MPTKAWHKDALDAYVNNGGFIPAEDGDGVRLACSTETEIGIYEAATPNRGVRSTEKNSVSSRHRQRHVRRPGRSLTHILRRHRAVPRRRHPAGALIEFPNNSHLGPMEEPREVASSASELFTDASSPSKFPSKL